jgi:hypothetical protein
MICFVRIAAGRWSENRLSLGRRFDGMARREPRPTTARREPRPTMARRELRPTTARRELRPTTARREPRPTMARRKLRPTMARRELRPTTARREPRPTMARREPRPTGVKRLSLGGSFAVRIAESPFSPILDPWPDTKTVSPGFSAPSEGDLTRCAAMRK